MDIVERLIELNEHIHSVIYNFRKQYYYTGWKECSKFTDKLEAVLNSCTSIFGDSFITDMDLPIFFDAMEAQDEILVADILEGRILTSVEGLIQALQANSINTENDYYKENVAAIKARGYEELADAIEAARPRKGCQYNIEYTGAGYPTIRISENGQGYYLSGNNNPFKDAYIYADGNLNEEIYKYILLGAGLFFEAKAILRLRPDAELIIVEEDPYLMQLAMRYVGAVDLINDERVQIIVQNYADYITVTDMVDRKVLVRKPSIRHIADSFEADVISRFFMSSMSLSEQRYLLDRNFRKNMQLDCIRSVDECNDAFEGKRVYLIGGGPSLDLSMNKLKERPKDSLVLSVGTSLKKLMSAGIIPEYVIITDVADSMYRQLHGVIDENKTKLLYLSTANYKALADFKGERFLICQNGMPDAVGFAEENGYTCFDTGGSVTTTAVDVCIRFKCSELVCMGLDFAFTGNKTHASGTLDQGKIVDNLNTAKRVKGVNGDELYTSENLHSYHVWIERRIENVKNVKFVNISNGAYIKGMENIPAN